VIEASSSEKKIQLLSSVIHQLSVSQGLSESITMIHAIGMRAMAYLDQIPRNVPLALMDAQRCTSLVSSIESTCSSSHQRHILDSSSVLFGKAYRILADAHEAAGNYDEAKIAINQWVRLNPTVKNKAEKDIQRLGKYPRIH
jgi:tetratricopeptide (TPR) repeat protein